MISKIKCGVPVVVPSGFRILDTKISRRGENGTLHSDENAFHSSYHFAMSKTVHIGSTSQFTQILDTSKIVVTDCMFLGLTAPPRSIGILSHATVSTQAQ